MPITSILRGLGGQGTKEEIYGKKPIVPDYPTLEKAQQDAANNNKNILPDAQEIAAKVNTFNQGELERMLKEAIPGLDSLQAGASASLNSMVRGELPPDVAALIERKSAESAVSGGFSGSGFHRNLTARDLGLTSLQLTQQGLSSAERWIAAARQYQVAPMSDVTAMFVSPAQQFASAEGKFQRDLYAAQIEAAPNPAARGAWQDEMEMIGMILSIYGGGGGYKGLSGGGNNNGPNERSVWGSDTKWTFGDPATSARTYNYNGAVDQAAGRLY
jgi:hypothetical protein